jgi:hypothetical protein
MSRYVQYWQFTQDCQNLNTITAQKRKEAMDLFCDPVFTRDYSFSGYLSKAAKSFSTQETMDVFDNIIKNYNWNSYYNGMYDFILSSYEIDPVKVKTEILNRNIDQTDKLLLALKDTTTDEEVRGLRALSKNKNIPSVIYKAKYSPTKEALDQLPSIMKLKTLESLCSNRHLSYNIFANFPDPDEFKTMMFSSVMRHRERAESVWQKYQEIAYLGQPAEIKITTQCDNCGEAEVIMKSTRVRTKAGLKNATIWHTYRYGGCPLCGQKAKNISVSGDEKDDETT